MIQSLETFCYVHIFLNMSTLDLQSPITVDAKGHQAFAISFSTSPSFQPAFALKHSYVLPNPAPVESIYLPLYTWAGQKREFIHSFIHSFIPSFIPSFMPSFLPSFLHSFLHSFIHSVIHSFIHSFPHYILFSWRRRRCAVPVPPPTF